MQSKTTSERFTSTALRMGRLPRTGWNSVCCSFFSKSELFHHLPDGLPSIRDGEKRRVPDLRHEILIETPAEM